MSSTNRIGDDGDLEEVSFGNEESYNRYSQRENGNNNWVIIVIVIVICLGGYFYLLSPAKPQTAGTVMEPVADTNSPRAPSFTPEEKVKI